MTQGARPRFGRALTNTQHRIAAEREGDKIGDIVEIPIGELKAAYFLALECVFDLRKRRRESAIKGMLQGARGTRARFHRHVVRGADRNSCVTRDRRHP